MGMNVDMYPNSTGGNNLRKTIVASLDRGRRIPSMKRLLWGFKVEV
jgi:hypothetical protein